ERRRGGEKRRKRGGGEDEKKRGRNRMRKEERREERRTGRGEEEGEWGRGEQEELWTYVKEILEGEVVMTNLQSPIKRFAVLFGLSHCKRTCEFIQKVLLGLDGKRMSTKVRKLSILLHSK
uniref:Uncharacterized protein n=1 Tax=Periophthalmus magnuspinnatus TaxID=409849 RepID=A0A3B3ZZI8_9GOBI